MTTKKNSSLTAQQIRELRGALARIGEAGLLELGISRYQLGRALGGFPVTSGTRAEIERAVATARRERRAS